MDGKKRVSFVKHFLPGLALLMIAYFFLTAYRDFRDNYMVEILDGLGYPYDDNQTIISRTETLVAFGVMITMALLNTIKHNRAGLVGAYVVMTGGVVLLGTSTLLFDWGMISGFWWLTLTGFGILSRLCSLWFTSFRSDDGIHQGRRNRGLCNLCSRCHWLYRLGWDSAIQRPCAGRYVQAWFFQRIYLVHDRVGNRLPD
jgi:hypothetical protein